MTTRPAKQETVEFKPCAWCDSPGEGAVRGNGLEVRCSNRECPIRYVWMSPKEWNTRATQPESEDGKLLDWFADWMTGNPLAEVITPDAAGDEWMLIQHQATIGKGLTFRAALRSASGMEGKGEV